MSTETPIKLIVGLGNPGQEYARTRHNCGADFIRMLAQEFRATLQSDRKFGGRIVKLQASKYNTHLLIPDTYMNHSGQSVGAFVKYYQIDLDSILIIHDELDLSPGTIRLKFGGGHGGHNGLRDIIHHLGSRDFHRMRIGIGHPGAKHLVHDYVLGIAQVTDRNKIDASKQEALQLMPRILKGHLQAVTLQLHTRSPSS